MGKTLLDECRSVVCLMSVLLIEFEAFPWLEVLSTGVLRLTTDTELLGVGTYHLVRPTTEPSISQTRVLVDLEYPEGSPRVNIGYIENIHR